MPDTDKDKRGMIVMNNDYREVIEDTEDDKATTADAESVSAVQYQDGGSEPARSDGNGDSGASARKEKEE